jgi:hypothetical protein
LKLARHNTAAASAASISQLWPLLFLAFSFKQARRPTATLLGLLWRVRTQAVANAHSMHNMSLGSRAAAIGCQDL